MNLFRPPPRSPGVMRAGRYWAVLGLLSGVSAAAALWRHPLPAGGAPPRVRGRGAGGRAVRRRGKIEHLTGAHARIVWVRSSAEARDSYAWGTRLRLMGLDTRDPRGRRPLVKERGNFSRPLIAPDGASVVYSNRIPQGEGPDAPWQSTIHLVRWDNSPPLLLREGYAVDCWSDPVTGLIWVYAFTTLQPGRSANPDGQRLIRFPLTDPSREEPVWEHGQLTGDNIQLNRSGTRASGLIPWPNAGCLDLTSGQFIRYREGCWPSLAPDDSGAAWVFDGSHKGLRMFLPGRDGTWRVSLGGSDGIGKKSTYHPRWSNHPRLLSFTGPYPNNKIDAASRAVDVVLARFSPDLTKIEASVKLRHTSQESDYYPDLWVSGGGEASLDPGVLGPDELRLAAAHPPAVADWIPAPDGLCFLWTRATTPNTTPSRPGTPCSVQPERYARTGPDFQMLTDGGHFSMDEASAAATRRALSSGTWSVELALTPLTHPPTGASVILHAGPTLELHQFQTNLILHLPDGAWQAGAGLTPGQTAHLFLTRNGPQSVPVIYLNGQLQELAPCPDPPHPRMTAGDGVTFGARPDGTAPWPGLIETVACHSRPPAPETALAHAAWWREKLARQPKAARTVVRAKLMEASPRASVETLGAYRRSWTSALYQKTALISGPDPGDRFGVAHWTILDLQPLDGPPAQPGSEIDLTIEPMSAHPEMDSEHGSEEVLADDQPLFLDMRLLGS